MAVDCHHVACVVCVVTKKKLRLGFLFQNWEKSHLISIGTGAEFRPLRTQKKILQIFLFPSFPYIFVLPNCLQWLSADGKSKYRVNTWKYFIFFYNETN